MKKVYAKNKKTDCLLLIAAAFFAALGIFFSLKFSENTKLPYADVQLRAAKRMEKALEAVVDYCDKNSIAIQDEDINQTGLIGPEWTALTTSLGILDAKRTALAPDWAALMVKFYKDAGLKEGDTVCAGFSGSFPGLCIATICAANEMDLNIKAIPSIGSSMYGATREKLNIITILTLLQNESIIDCDILAVSLGGDFDSGGGNILFPDSRKIMMGIAENSGFQIIYEESVADSIKKRLSIYGDDVSCFVNVGGASVNMGIGSYGVAFPNGLVRTLKYIPSFEERGLMFEYLVRGVNVIHLLNIKDLAAKNGLSIDPTPLPKAGESFVYYTITKNKTPAFISVLITLMLIFILIHQKITFRKKAMDRIMEDINRRFS